MVSKKSTSQPENPDLVLVGANFNDIHSKGPDCSTMLRNASEQLRHEIAKNFRSSSITTLRKRQSVLLNAWNSIPAIPGFRRKLQPGPESESTVEPVDIAALQRFGQTIAEQLEHSRALVIAMVDPRHAPVYAAAAAKAVTPSMLRSSDDDTPSAGGSVIVMPKPQSLEEFPGLLQSVLVASKNLGGRMAFADSNQLLALPGLIRGDDGSFRSIYQQIGSKRPEFSNWTFDQSRNSTHYPAGIDNQSFTLDRSVVKRTLHPDIDIGTKVKGLVVVDDPSLNGQRGPALSAIERRNIPTLLVADTDTSGSGILQLQSDDGLRYENIFDIKDEMTPDDALIALSHGLGSNSSRNTVENRNRLFALLSGSRASLVQIT